MSKIFALGLFFMSLFLSCDILRDSPFEVSSWTPDEGVYSGFENIRVSLNFSKEPYRTSVENAFSFTEDGEKVKGSFLWNGDAVVFLPAYPLQINKDYTITLAVDARTKDGLSLDEKFERHFSTRSGIQRPAVLSVEPLDTAVIDDTTANVIIKFSTPVDLLSCINDISFNPSIKGIWHLDNHNLTAVFTPDGHWQIGKTYRLTVSSSFKSAGGKMLGKSFESRWTVGDDFTAPVLKKVSVIDLNDKKAFVLNSNNNLVSDLEKDSLNNSNPLSPIVENSLWESAYNLKFIFSKDIDVNKIKNFILIEPTLKYSIDPPFGYSSDFKFIFDEKVEWGKRYNLKVNSGVSDEFGNLSEDTSLFRLYANGKYFMPPKLSGLCFPTNPNANNSANIIYETFTVDDLYSLVTIDSANFIYEVPTTAFFELYFDVAEDADIDLFSLRDLFKIETTNNAISFSARAVVADGFTRNVVPDQFIGKKRVEVRGLLTNSINSGLVAFSIGKGLEDTKKNKNQNEMKIQLAK